MSKQKKQIIEEINIATDPIEKLWERRAEFKHIPIGKFKEQLETRNRLKKVRYMVFRLRTQIEKNEPLTDIEGLLPGFIDFWLAEKPLYAIDPRGNKIAVPHHKNRSVFDLGGYATFAQNWDVNEDLHVYIRHSSIWQEWNATLYKIVPIMGDL